MGGEMGGAAGEMMETDDVFIVDDAASQKRIFKVGQQILAVNKNQLYVAKIQKIRQNTSDGEDEYFVHYLGWKSRHDEWMRESKLHADDDAGRHLQKQMVANNTTLLDPNAWNVEATGGNESDDEETAGIKLAVPNTLQKQLLEEGELITNKGKLHPPVPRRPSVKEILYQFVLSKEPLDQVEQKLYAEVKEGITSYMDKGAGMILCYKHEYNAHAALMAQHPGAAPSSLYGAEHLLRLVVMLPSLLKKAEMPQRSMSALQPRLQELLRFMEKNFVAYFLTEPQYVDRELLE